MTEKEMILKAISQIGKEILYQDETNLEIRNSCMGENISFVFDKDGNITDIYS